jgi:choline-sulfatase
MLDDTWIVYTSDHGEMAGDHGLMSKCVMYEQTVRVPLIIRPPGCEPRVVDDLVELLDVPATVRAIAGAPEVPKSEGRSLLGHVDTDAPDPEPRRVSVSENWGFAAFVTDRYKLVIDEDAFEPCALFDLVDDACEDENLVAGASSATVGQMLLESAVRVFLAQAPARPHNSPFTS